MAVDLKVALERMASQIDGWVEGIHHQAESEMKDLAEGGEFEMRRIIETSETPTGRARAAAGQGVAGRIKTGEMIGLVEQKSGKKGEGTYFAEWGWLEDLSSFNRMKFQNQETRTGADYDAMQSVHNSFEMTVEDFAEKLKGLGK